MVLVGRGATDPDANAEVAKTARLLLEGRGLGTVETAFVSLAEPSVTAGPGPGRAAGLPADRGAALLPVRGRAAAADPQPRARQWAEGRDVDVTVADLIGPSPNLAALVAQRAAELDAGDIRMNCDTCMYRTLMPGFEGKVGLPQTPHDHPDDPTHSHRARGPPSPLTTFASTATRRSGPTCSTSRSTSAASSRRPG